MFRRESPVPATGPALPLSPDEAHDTCFKCGRPTPPGVSLCADDNPARIKSPSPTQVHGTIVVGVVAGFVLLAGMLGLATTGVGPYPATVSGAATRPDGGLEVVITVRNDGVRQAGASCRVSASGTLDYRDAVVFTEPIPAGGSISFSQVLPPSRQGEALSPSSVLVHCN